MRKVRLSLLALCCAVLISGIPAPAFAAELPEETVAATEESTPAPAEATADPAPEETEAPADSTEPEPEEAPEAPAADAPDALDTEVPDDFDPDALDEETLAAMQRSIMPAAELNMDAFYAIPDIIELWRFNPWYDPYISGTDAAHPSTYKIDLPGAVFTITRNGNYTTVTPDGLVSCELAPSVIVGETTGDYLFDKWSADLQIEYGNQIKVANVVIHNYADVLTQRTIDQVADSLRGLPLYTKDSTPNVLDNLGQYVNANYSYGDSSDVNWMVAGPKYGNCVAQAVFTSSVCNKLGITNGIRDASGDPGGGAGHVNLQVFDPSGVYYIFDTSYIDRHYTVKEFADVLKFEEDYGYVNGRLTKRGYSLYSYDALYAKNINYGNNIVIPETYNGEPVTFIGGGVFANLNDPLRITVPKTVAVIGQQAFYNSPNITLIVPCGSYAESYARSEGLRYEVTHTPTPVPGTPATCTATGLTDGSVCSGCGAVLEAQQTIPATGMHDWSAWTSADDGHHIRHCAHCDASETAVHNWDAGEVSRQPTCTADGEIRYTCESCGATRTGTVPARHEYELHDGKYYCKNCGHMLERLPGDENGDGKADFNDGIYLFYHYMRANSGFDVAAEVDYNHDGVCNYKDGMYLFEHFIRPDGPTARPI